MSDAAAAATAKPKTGWFEIFKYQFSALFRKNLALQRRQLKLTLCQLLVPAILLSIIGLIQLLIDNTLSDRIAGTEVDVYSKVNLSEFFRPNTQDFYDVARAQQDPLSIIRKSTLALPFYYGIIPESEQAEVGVLSYDPEVDNYGLLGRIKQTTYPEINITESLQDVANLTQSIPQDLLNGVLPATRWPFFLSLEDNASFEREIIATYLDFKNLLGDNGLTTRPDASNRVIGKVLEYLENREYNKLLPLGAILFDNYNVKEGVLDVVLRPAGRYGGWSVNASAIPPPGKNKTKLPLLTLTQPNAYRQGNMLNLLTNTFLKDYFNGTSPFRIQTYFQGQPQKTVLSFDVAGLVGIFLFGFATSFLLPVFVANIVLDKQERILIMMRMSGLIPATYWTVNVVYSAFLYVIVTAVVFLCGFAFQMRLFTQTSIGLLLIMFTLHGVGLIVLSFLLSVFFKTTRASSIITYLLVIVMVVISNTLNSSTFAYDAPPFIYYVIPPLAFYRGLFLLEGECLNLHCVEWNDYATGDGSSGIELRTITWWLIADAVWIVLVTAWASEVFVGEYGVARPWYFCFQWLMPQKPKAPVSEDSTNAPLLADSNNNDNSESTAVQITGEDPDVFDEQKRIQEGRVSDKSVVIIRGLRKVYDTKPPKVAVRGLYLTIRRDECFGLLGANGAGKTSLISMLTGLFPSTSGFAEIDGFDSRYDMPEIQKRLGVCPQFDIFYPELSCREHLQFYARLKGVSAQKEKSHIDEILRSVGLAGAASNRLAKELSGGMRRRLSMAISIVGDPKVVILDEPTTGLDPLTRRQVWDVLRNIKPGRSIILTTHSMEEADTLCDRIGMMAHGRLRCLGTSTRLKTLHGSGYRLSLTTTSAPVSMAFVEQVAPGSRLISSFSGTLSFQVPISSSRSSNGDDAAAASTAGVKISDVFKAFASERRPAEITDWGLNMADLEDVFLNVVKDEEKEIASLAK